MSARIRYGMVGGGEGAFIGAVHRMAARLDDRFELVCGAFSSDPERSRQSGLNLGVTAARCYPDYPAMFEAESRLPETQRMECVVIVTPNHLHYPVASAALARGFHVISDKPATLNLQECRQLATEVAESGCLYALTHPYTQYPMVREARDRVAAGELGTLRKVLVEYTQGWLSQAIEQDGQKQASWRTSPTESGASCCFGDIGVHAFNLAEFVTGLEVSRLSSCLRSVVPGRQLDDDGSALLEFSNGASGVLLASQVCVGEENNLHIRLYGDKAGLEWSQQEPNSLWLKYADRPSHLLRTGGSNLGTAAQAAARLPMGHPEGYIEAFANLYRQVAEQLRMGGAADYPDIRDALRGMAFIETAVASSAGGGVWLEFPAV